jgi:hypothetical protein
LLSREAEEAPPGACSHGCRRPSVTTLADLAELLSSEAEEAPPGDQIREGGREKREKGDRGRRKKGRRKDDMWAPHIGGSHNILVCDRWVPQTIF